MEDGLAAVILGHFSHPERRRVIAALVLGASTVADLELETGLDGRAIATALSRLADAGLVLNDKGGNYWLIEDAIRQAASEARTAEPVDREHADAPPEAARVLRAFVHGHRLLSIPSQRSKRLVVLDLLAQDFEPGERYRERTVNAMLRTWHDDTAALRRYLVDEGFLEREQGEYGRSGGTYPI